MPNEDITTIKLNKKTKARIDKIRVHKRETYDEILQRVFSILNICIANPEGARERLIGIEKQRKKFKAESLK